MEDAHPDEVRYDFREGLRSLLLDAVPTADAAEVLERVSSYVEEHLGEGRDFRAILADPTAVGTSLQPDRSPFARVAAEVLLRLGGDYARLVRRPTVPRRSVAPGCLRRTSRGEARPPNHSRAWRAGRAFASPRGPGPRASTTS